MPPPSPFGSFLTITLILASFLTRALTDDDTMAQTLLIAGLCTAAAYLLTALFWVTTRSRVVERD